MNLIIILLIIFAITSAHVIRYDHNLEFVMFEVNELTSTKENNLVVKIYSIESMEQKFNKLVEDYKRKQQQIFENNKEFSKNLTETFQTDFNQKNENFSRNLDKIRLIFSYKNQLINMKSTATKKFMLGNSNT